MALTLEAARKAALEALTDQKYFDGVQLVNNAMEAWEAKFLSSKPDLPASEKLDILRTPEAFLTKMMAKLEPAQKTELSQMYSVRARLLAGLGAQKRAIIDINAAMQLASDNAEFSKVKKDLEEKAASGGETTQVKVPTSIITGFLGSGKTTLLNHILSENHGKRIAIIENEFGEVGIDDKLLNTKNAVTEENIIEMNNGCICCTVRGDLIAGMKKLHKQTAGKGKPLDGIIIETTGLADPAPVAQTFFADDFIQSNMTLDSILTVVDAKHCLMHLQEEKPDDIVNEAIEQVAFADRIILNKIDLVSGKELDEVQAHLRSINSTAQIRRCKNAVVDMDFLLGLQAFSLDSVLERVKQGFLEEDDHGHGDEKEGHGHGHDDHGHDDHGHDHDGHDHDCGEDHGHGGHGGHDGHKGHDGHDGHSGHDGHKGHDGHDGHKGHDGHDGHDGHKGHDGHDGHDSHKGHDGHDGHSGHGHKGHKGMKHTHDYRVSSVGIERDAELRKDKLDTFISWLAQEKGKDLYRSKGVLAVKDIPNKFVFHAVHMQMSGKLQDEWKEDEKRCCKMVFIGKNLDRKELNDKFDECVAK